MARISEMGKVAQAGAIILVALLISAGLYLGIFRRMSDRNRLDTMKLQAKQAEMADLKHYENNLPELDRQIEILKQQLEIQRKIVPDEQEADQFMHVMQDTAQNSGIEIRKWTAKPIAVREFYTEAPYDLELDGPYYSVLDFFSRVARLERIINVTNLQLGAIKGKGKYQYAPQESVTGTCTATTFYAREGEKAPAPRGKK